MTTVAVVGLGKIGLPLAAQFASRGLQVIGCDVVEDVVAAVNAGRTHIHEEPGLRDAVAQAVRAGRLVATTDTTQAAKQADVILVIVPLMVGPDREPDFRDIDSVTAAVARGLHKGALVVYETTLPVGTTRHRFGPALEKGSGLKAGSDFHLAFSPERVYAGRMFEDLRRYPKIVGGVDTASTEKAVEFYRTAVDAEVWPVENAETAEFTKLAETTYRDVNIALANQLAMYGVAREVNVGEAFKAANSQPFSHLHRASIGVGGHCIPVYPHFLLRDAQDGELSLVKDARSTNDGMATVGVRLLQERLGDLRGRPVLVLGASYREDVKELAFSTSLLLIDKLHRAGADVMLHDPLFQPEELRAFEADVVAIDGDRARSAEAIVVQAWHRQFRDLDWSAFRSLVVVLDGRGSVDPASVRASGARYIAIDGGSGGDDPRP